MARLLCRTRLGMFGEVDDEGTSTNALFDDG
jgi:hypothetical protein